MKIESETGFSEESLRRIAEQKIKYRLSIKIHFFLYLLGNSLLVLINLLTLSYYFWFLFPLLGWFIGLTMHVVAYCLYAKGVYPMAKRAVILHFFAYLTVNLLLFAIDTNVMHYFTFGSLRWAYYPAIFWGVGLLLHIIVYFTYFSGSVIEKGVGKSKKERAIEKEMLKMKKRTLKKNK